MERNEKVKIDFVSLCARHGIRPAQPGERHYRGGDWIALPCPYCTGKEGNHLGFNTVSNTFSCYRCGRHGKFETLSLLLGVSMKEAVNIAKEFALDAWQQREQEVKRLREISDREEEKENTEFTVPGKLDIPKRHRLYLKNRGFSAEKLRDKWGIRFCDKQGQYAYRIIIPVTKDGQIVSFTTRDVTDMAQERYLACPPDEAIVHHKHCVYGLDRVGDVCIVVEGTFGVWRIGRGAVCTLGTGWTIEQATLIAKKCKKSYIFFDPDEKEATKRANQLSKLLSSFPKHESYVIEGKGANGRDTAELTDKERATIRALLKQ